MIDADVQQFDLRFDPMFAAASRLFGVRSANSFVRVSDVELTARFGPWTVTTPRSNVRSATTTGPYAWPKVIGPAHLTFSDHGLTFASNSDRGTCIDFVEPVAGIDPWGRLRHPNLTVTVDDAAALAALLD